jgi:hypothetical protein
MNALLASKNWAIALVIALMLSTSYLLDELGPNDMATEQAIALDVAQATSAAAFAAARAHTKTKAAQAVHVAGVQP